MYVHVGVCSTLVGMVSQNSYFMTQVSISICRIIFTAHERDLVWFNRCIHFMVFGTEMCCSNPPTSCSLPVAMGDGDDDDDDAIILPTSADASSWSPSDKDLEESNHSLSTRNSLTPGQIMKSEFCYSLLIVSIPPRQITHVANFANLSSCESFVLTRLILIKLVHPLTNPPYVVHVRNNLLYGMYRMHEVVI